MLNKLYKYDLLILDDFTFIVAFSSVIFICFLWSYDQGCCGRTFKGSMDVRP